MKTGGMVLGIIGGVIGLLIGVLGFALGGVAGSGGFQFVSLAIPIAGLAGGGMAKAQPVLGGILMLVAAGATIYFFGVNLVSLLPGVFLGLGGALCLMPEPNTAVR